MKTRVAALICMTCVLFSYQTISAQEFYPASSFWELSNPAMGGTGGIPSIAGNIVAYNESGGSNTQIRDYAGYDGSQRTQIVGSAWPANQTTLIEDVYVQFSLAPKPYSIFHLDSISLEITCTAISTMSAEVYITTDTTNPTAIPVTFTTGQPNNYIPRDDFFLIGAAVDLTVNDGDRLYLRVYPWVEDPNERTGKYICLRNVKISGEIESLAQEASVIWPIDVTGSYQVTGPVLAETTSYSDSMKYYGTARLPKAGTTDTLDMGAIHTTTEDWQTGSSPSDTLFVECAAGPKYGGTFILDSIALWIAGWNTGTLRAKVAYSKDPSFSIETVLIADSALLNNEAERWIIPVVDTIFTNETLYLRVFPYNTTTESGEIMPALNDVSLYGLLEGTTADPPTVTTADLSYLSTTFVTSGGNIPTDGGMPVLERGVVWNTSGDATTADNKTMDDSGSGSFISQVTGLTPATTYYLRSYATNAAGTGYGDEKTFTTLATVIPPTVTTDAASQILAVSAEGGGEVTDWGGDTVDVRGLCWNTTGTPTIDDSISIDGGGLGSFNSFMYPLIPNTTYYARAYATNSAGTDYGNEVSFTTQQVAPDVNVVVAKDGSGDYTTVQAAFDDVPDYYTGKYTIHVRSGTYFEKLLLTASKTNVILQGAHPDSTILTYDDYSGRTGSLSTNYSVAIDADDFTALDITIQNTEVNDGDKQGEQGVALHIGGDRQSYYRCKITGYQDTYYGHSTGRVYMKHCHIEGNVDYIFGKFTLVVDSSDLHINRNGAEITAANTEAESKFGIVFRYCRITHDQTDFNGNTINTISLGRPWQNSPRTVYMWCYEPAAIKSSGWDAWGAIPAIYGEYQCYGPGSDTAQRIAISRQLTDAEAETYTLANIFARTTHPSYSYDWIPDENHFKSDQYIRFDPIPETSLDAGTINVAATASSGLAVSYSSSNTDVATISGDQVNLLSAGSTDITASQEGNYLYYPAEEQVQTLTVGPASTDVMKSGEINIYPNPANKRIVIERISSSREKLAIYSTNGQKIYEYMLEQKIEDIDISMLDEGMYLVSIQNKIIKLAVQ